MVASGFSTLLIGLEFGFHIAASTCVCCQLERSIRVRNFYIVPAGECLKSVFSFGRREWKTSCVGLLVLATYTNIFTTIRLTKHCSFYLVHSLFLAGGDAAARQQVLPPAPNTNAKSDASAATKSMPPPPSSGHGGAALPSTLSTAGIINSATSPRHTAIAPLPNNSAASESSGLSDAGYSSATSGGVVMADKKFHKRAANRRSAQLSRKRKKQFIEELKDENDELRRKEQILRSIPDLIVVFDSTGKLWFVSQSVSRFMNMTAKELEGTSFWDRLCEDSVRLLKAAFMDSLAARNDDSDSAPLGCGIWELRLVDKDGSHKIVTLNGVVHFSGDRPECVCSIRPRDDPSMLPKRKQRKTADAAAATTDGKTEAAATVSTSNGSGNGSDGTDTTTTSTDPSSSGSGVRFQPLVRAMPQQSVINNSSAPSARIKKMKAVAVNGKRREAARISDGDSGSTDDTDSGSSDGLGEETTA